MGKSLHPITNWPTYNKSLINRGSLTFWVDTEAKLVPPRPSWAAGPQPTLHRPDHLYLPDAQGDFQSHFASNSGTTRLPVRVDERTALSTGTMKVVYTAVPQRRDLRPSYRFDWPQCIWGRRVEGQKTRCREATYLAQLGYHLCGWRLRQQSQPSAYLAQRGNSLYSASQKRGIMGKGTSEK